jgi:hypothetical protein
LRLKRSQIADFFRESRFIGGHEILTNFLMSDLAYFEYTAVVRSEKNQLEGTPAHYLVEVRIRNPNTGEERNEEELKRLANDFLTLASGLDVQQIAEFREINESDARTLKKIRPVGTHYDGAVFLVE